MQTKKKGSKSFYVLFIVSLTSLLTRIIQSFSILLIFINQVSWNLSHLILETNIAKQSFTLTVTKT